MSLQDIKNAVAASRGLSPVTITDNTAQVSQIIDTANYSGVMFVVLAGALADADATFTALLEDGDDSSLSDAAAVASSDRVGSLPSFTFADDNAVKTVGYIGKKRYLRLTITPANNTGSAAMAIAAIQMHPRKVS